MNKDPFIFDLDNKSTAVATRSRITTTIPNTGALKTPTGEHYSVQIVTTLPYGTNVLRHAVTLGVAGANNYFRYAWGPQDSEEPAYVVILNGTDKENTVEDLLSRSETSLLDTARTRHAVLFKGRENTAALLRAMWTLTERANALEAQKVIDTLPQAVTHAVNQLIDDIRPQRSKDTIDEARHDLLLLLANEFKNVN